MRLNLETDFLKYESVGATAYYGYANPGTSELTKSWSLRRVLGTGSSFSVSWNQNSEFSYSANWTNRGAYFASVTPSVAATWSQSDSTNSFGITRTLVNLTWTDLAGVEFYKLKISDQNGIIYNYLHEPLVNPYVIEKITTSIRESSYIFIGVPNMTYSVTITKVNSTGDNSDPGSPYQITT